MFKQLAEKSFAESSFILHSKEMEDFEKKKTDKSEISPIVKLKNIIGEIERNMGTNICYMDPAVYINGKNIRPFYKYILNFKDLDLCLPRHTKRNGYSTSFMKIKCTKKTLALFEHVLERVKKNNIESEEGVVNNVVKEWEGRIAFEELNSKVVSTPFISSDAIRQNFFAWNILTKNEGLTQSKLYDNKVKIVFDHRFINREDYNYYRL